jgi:2-oxoglutarate ferredoxin oxidoreductase subunit beta
VSISFDPTLSFAQCLLGAVDEHHELDEYQTGVPRWCNGCGDNGILAAMQRLCRDHDLAPERTVFVSGIGCSSRLPHYMKTYGFHGLHGRALPIAEGIKMSRPDLPVFVSTGDGDCLSIGAGHWIHAIRYNMDMTVLLHDNSIYGLTKKQVSPTSPLGTKSNTTPRGSYLEALNPLTVALGVQNVSFIAQMVDWIPEMLYDILDAAYRHKGFSFVRIIQRCPEFMPGFYDPYMADPERILLVTHPDGITPSANMAKVYRNQRVHDPTDLAEARDIASSTDPIPVGILYQDPDVPRLEVVRGAGRIRTPDTVRRGLDAELDKFTIWPDGEAPSAAGSEFAAAGS